MTETVKPKLSDAMRLADEMGLPDLQNEFVAGIVDDWGGEKPPCCAIAGANIASGRVRIEPVNRVVPHWQQLAVQRTGGFDYPKRFPKCPASNEVPPEGESFGCSYSGSGSTRSRIIHLYDDHGWSRTEIADWLDSLETPAGAGK